MNVAPTIVSFPPNYIPNPYPSSSSSAPVYPSGLARSWTRPLCASYCNDETDQEACWYGTWCTWLLMGRTIQSLNLGRSLAYTTNFWFMIVLLILSFLVGGLQGAIIGSVLFSIAYTVINAYYRGRIRQQFNIFGDCVQDTCVHILCDNSAVLQEYAEARAANAPSIDFCSGEPLQEIERKNLLAQGSNDSALPPGGTLMSHFSMLSSTSRILIGLNLTAAAIVSLVLFAIGQSLTVAVLLLIFVQPLLILYFVYWRARRSHISLDAVVKIFTLGFYVATFQSIVCEMALQSIVGSFLSIFASSHEDVLGDSSSASGFILSHIPHKASTAIVLPAKNVLNLLVKGYSTALSRVAGSSGVSLASSLSSPNTALNTMSSVSWPHEMTTSLFAAAASSTTSPSADDTKRTLMKHNIVLVFIALFLMVTRAFIE